MKNQTKRTMIIVILAISLTYTGGLLLAFVQWPPSNTAFSEEPFKSFDPSLKGVPQISWPSATENDLSTWQCQWRSNLAKIVEILRK